MKRLLLLTTLIGLLFTISDGFAQSSKPRHGVIEYPDGGKYVGEIQKVNPRVFNGKKKLRHGKGIMYFANGDKLEGVWNTDSCNNGTITYAQMGSIVLGNKTWYHPANCHFIGVIDHSRPYTGKFDGPLTNEKVGTFTGEIAAGHFKTGKIEYSNGNIFDGNFENDTPSSGKYRYGDTTEITRANHKWKIPAGCVFEGDLVTFTGRVDMAITNATGDKFVGKLNNGAPDEGTMIFAATGHSETGKFINGLSPRAYEIKLRQEEERLRQEAQREAQIYDQKCLQVFEDYVNKRITEGMAKNIWNTCELSIICGYFFGRLRAAEELIHGASIKLSQLYVNKKVTYSKTGNDIYTCTSVNHIANLDKYIVMTLKPDKGGQIKKLYLTNVRISKSPQLTSFLPIKYPYPNTLPYTYFRCETIETKESESPLLFQSVSLVTDNERNARSCAKDYWIRRFGSDYGTAVFNREIKLGMTVEMVQIIKGAEGDVSRKISSGGEIIRLHYSGSSYTFVNNRLIEILEY